MKKVAEAQKFLAAMKVDGWLLYDFQGNNELARHVLSIPAHQMTSRRFFYWIPTRGTPVKLVHAIESHVLDHCPGEKKIFFSWQSLQSALALLLKGAKTIAMEYSPNNAIPYVSKVDAGTVDFLRSLGLEIGSSAEFLSHFTAVLDDAQIQSQTRAAQALDQIVQDTWKWIGEHLQQSQPLTEYEVQQKLLLDFKKRGLWTDHPPIVGVNEHSADPHYSPQKEGSKPIRKGDFILIDLFAKETREEAVWGDITRVALAASQPTARHREIFQIVRKAQTAALTLVRDRFHHQLRLEGWEVDEAARRVIRDAGYGEFFLHRTGHSIERSLHGSGPHMDNLEMHDVRPLLPRTCFSIEPGIYLPQEFGVRLELDVLIHPDGRIDVSSGEQDTLICLL